MVGSRLSCFFTASPLLLLVAWLHDVEASSCQHVIHKKVGDTVELPSCSPSEGVTAVTWKHGRSIVADMNQAFNTESFANRLTLNPQNFSLTLTRLTLRDSGDFMFISEVNHSQRPTVTITLHVHEAITRQPDMTHTSVWNDQNKSCTVLLECRSNSNVTYIWSVRNQTQKDSTLQYNMRPEDGETTFICTISNYISNESAAQTVTCSNSTTTTGLVIILCAAGGSLLLVAIVGIAVAVCCCKQEQAGSDSHDLTVYADVTDLANEIGTSTLKPCSVYETIDNRITPPPKILEMSLQPKTVYDKIQFNRTRKPSVSPYQEVS